MSSIQNPTGVRPEQRGQEEQLPKDLTVEEFAKATLKKEEGGASPPALSERKVVDLQQQSKDFFTAAQTKSIPQMMKILDLGIDPAYTDRRTLNTILHVAVELKDLNVVKKVLSLGVELSAKNRRGYTALWLAVNLEVPKIVEEILKKDAGSVDIPNKQGQTPLFWAVSKGNLDLVKLLVVAGANPSLHIDNKGSPLHIADAHKNLPIAKFLLKKGADPDKLDGEGWSFSTSGNLKSSVCDLMPDMEKKDFQMRLIKAAENYDLEKVREALETEVELNFQDEKGKTALHYAAEMDVPKITGAILDAGASRGIDVNIQDQEGKTPLFLAVERGGLESAKLILEGGGNPDIPDNNQILPVHIAFEMKSMDMLQLLVTKAKDLNIPDKSNRTLLHSALVMRNKQAVEILLKAGASTRDVDLKLVHIFISQDRMDGFDLILSAIPESKSAISDGNTPIFTAITKGKLEYAEKLLQQGVDCNLPCTSELRTPLHVAIAEKKLDMIKLLLKYGADHHIKNGKGVSSLDFAGMNEYGEATYLFLQKALGQP